MASRQPFDLRSPEAQALRDEIVHGTFVKEGTLVAFPLCFPGCSTPIPADESRITALDVSGNWMVYGGTSGRQARLFVGMFHGATGMVLDMGAVEGATECAAMCCGRRKLVAFVNGPAGGRAITRPLQGLPFDLLQEWGFSRLPYEDLGEVVRGERVVHAVTEPGTTQAIGATEGHLFTVSLDDGKIEVVGEVPGAGRLAVASRGGVFCLHQEQALWGYDPRCGTLRRNAYRVPEGAWSRPTWARDPVSGKLYSADDSGHLYSFTEEEGFNGPLGRTTHAPVGPMAVTLDGRVFGWCGDGIARLFSLNAWNGALADLGCAVSVLERRRYGYQFGAAALGRDGQVYFGENDALGHLWIYLPRIQARQG